MRKHDLQRGAGKEPQIPRDMGGSEGAQDGRTRMLTLEAPLDRILWVASDRKLIHMRLKEK